MAENKEILTETLKHTPESVENRPDALTDLQAREERLPKELDSWIKKIEKDPRQQVINDDNNQPLLQTTASTTPKVVLPVTRQKFIAGFKRKVDEAGRWLSTFILKLIKTKGGEVEFRKDK